MSAGAAMEIFECSSSDGSVGEGHVKLYGRRWLMLALFFLYSSSNGFQWIQYSIISNIVSRFYSVPLTTTNWLSMVFMVCYVIFMFPVTWLVSRIGLRAGTIICSMLNAVGALIKIGSAEPNLFAVTMLGQTLCAISQPFFLGMPSKLAATWFGCKEVSTACAIGVLSNLVGVGIGLFLPSVIVPDVDDTSLVAAHLRYMFIGTAVVTTVIAILIITCFEKQPDLPPSLAQLNYLKSETENETFLHSVKQVMSSTSSLLLILTFGLNCASYVSLLTLLNQEILDKFQGETIDAGRIGLTTDVSGIVGALTFGVWLDRSKLYKATDVVGYIASFLAMVFYTASLASGNLLLVYISSACLGFAVTGYITIAFEFMAEISYPVSEETSCSLMMVSSQSFGILIIFGLGRLIPASSVLGGNIFFSATLLLGAVLTIAIQEDPRRQRANTKD